MTNIFEVPWLILIIGVVAFMAVGTWRALTPDKNRWWQWCIPLSIALLALGLDFFIATDQEKIKTATKQLMQSVADEDFALLNRILTPDYRDGMHKNRDEIIAHARSGLEKSPVKKTTILSRTPEKLVPPHATVELRGSILFDEESHVASAYKAFIFVTIRIHLQKQADKSWKIREIELIEVDKQPMTWSQVPGSVW